MWVLMLIFTVNGQPFKEHYFYDTQKHCEDAEGFEMKALDTQIIQFQMSRCYPMAQSGREDAGQDQPKG